MGAASIVEIEKPKYFCNNCKYRSDCFDVDVENLRTFLETKKAHLEMYVPYYIRTTI